MIELLGGVWLFRDVRPDVDGFQPSLPYVFVCLLAPALLGLLVSALIGWLGKLGGRKGQGDGGA
jgi:hypothetical protein